ncbi:phage tailspike protein [Buttiauxella sp.]|uniref:phage tailspike protein n=1 Tax=Buttiauxella sp. TaxID=1972222 RepID=UPI003C756AF7
MSDISANVVVSNVSQLFTSARSFKALSNGKIYIGKIDTDPVNPANRIQVYLENEDGSHVPVVQPLIINAGGYPVYNGQIAKFVTVEGHSMAIYNAFGVQEFYYPNVLKYDPDQLRTQLASPGGAGMVGGVAKPVTWTGFAGGADPTGVASSDAAFAAASAADVEVYIPSGIYLLTSNHTGRFVFADACQFSGAGKAYKKADEFFKDVNPKVEIARHNRMFIGDAAAQSDGYSGGATTWLGLKNDIAPNGSLQPGLTWPERNAQFASFTSLGGGAIVGAAHTKQLTGGSSQALIGVGVNDNETVLTSCRGMYLDAKRYANSVGPAYSAEMQIANLGTFIDEYSSTRQKTYGIALFSGGDPAINGTTNDVTVALSIANNGSRFGTGLTFSTSALRVISEAGLPDYGRAMTLRGGQRIGWEDSAGGTRAFITSSVSDNTRRMGIQFQNGVFDIVGPTAIAFRASGVVGDTGYIRTYSSDAVNQTVRLTVEGLTDASVSLEGRGSGNIIVNKAIRPNAANALLCGTSTFPWSGGFTQTAFTVTSDEKCKTEPLVITDAMLDAAAEVEWVQYQYLERVEAKGPDGARWHFGAIAQRYVEAFNCHGLDAHRFGFICYDEWEDQYIQVQTNVDVLVTKTRTIIEDVLTKKTRTVKRTVMTTELRDTLVDAKLEDGTPIKRVVKMPYQVPEVTKVFIFNEDGSPHTDEFGEHLYSWEPVFEDVEESYTERVPTEIEESYTEQAEPEYESVLQVPAGSRYGIRYEEALVLEAALQRRNYQRVLERIEALEGRAKYQ